jgi:proliferating cell nuclear antigen
MNSQQIQQIDEQEERVFLESSESVQVSFKTDKATLLQIAKTAECMYDDATFTIDEEGLSYRMMDPSHVSLADIGIPNSCFETWSCIEKQVFALNIEELRKLVNSLDAKGSIKVEIQKEKILVTQNGFQASMKTIEPSTKDVPLPRIAYDSTIVFSENEKINTMEFVRTIRKIATVSDYVTINCDDDKVVFSGKGDNGESQKTFTKEQFELRNRQDSETTYSLEYLMPFMRTLSKDSEIEIGFSTAKPMRIQTRINNLGRIDLYLAPRVES